jgi:hypothetical protein
MADCAAQVYLTAAALDSCRRPNVQALRSSSTTLSTRWNVRVAKLHGVCATTRISPRRPNVLGVSCTACPACRSRSGAAVAANELPCSEWRTATAVTPSRWRRSRQLGCRAEAGPCQLHTKVRRRLGSANTTFVCDPTAATILPMYMPSPGNATPKKRNAPTQLVAEVSCPDFGSENIACCKRCARLNTSANGVQEAMNRKTGTFIATAREKTSV